MEPTILDAQLVEDRTSRFSVAQGSHPDAHKRDVTLKITRGTEGPLLRILPAPELQDRFPATEVPLTLTAAKLSALVEECQRIWWHELVDRKTLLKKTYPFQETAEKPVTESEYKGILRKLAKIGEALFVQIFRPARHAITQEIGTVLRELIATPDLWITIHSEDFFVPWNLLYSGDARNPVESGFWGYQHMIEHDVSRDAASTEPLVPNPRMAVHLDETIDIAFPKFECNEKVLQVINGAGLMPTPRNNQIDFEQGLRNCTDEHIFYFCCHARSGNLQVQRPELFLTAPSEAITPIDIDTWLDRCGNLPGRPLVFINACEAARTGSIFYDGFASKFLDHSARAVIGPELEMPVVFARDFAVRFFTDFFRAGKDNSVGQILLRLRREYMTHHFNPLGLVYSLYRGGGLFLAAPGALGGPDNSYTR